MQVGNGLSIPVYWVDRLVSVGEHGYTGVVAPHAATARWVYTCPAAKKAVVVPSLLTIQRVTAAAPVGRVRAFLTVNIQGGGELSAGEVSMLKNAIGDQVQSQIFDSFYLQAGDKLTLWTEDLSTGGTVYFAGSMLANEFST